MVLFACSVVVLAVASVTDLRDRTVPNWLSATAMTAGASLSILTGDLFLRLPVYISTILFVLLIAYVLFRIGALGGGDAKILLAVAIISPGTVFVEVDSALALLEGVVPFGLMLVLTLGMGHIYHRMSNSSQQTPLVPLMLLSYLMVQLFPIVLWL